MVAEFNERGDLVIWVNVTRHTASFLLGYVVVVAKESLKLLVLVRFQVSQPFLLRYSVNVARAPVKRLSDGSSPSFAAILLYNNCGDSNSKKVVTV